MVVEQDAALDPTAPCVPLSEVRGHQGPDATGPAPGSPRPAAGGQGRWNSWVMPWSPDTVFTEGLGVFSAAVEPLLDSDWTRASPCSEWTVLDVLGHVGTAVGFGTELLRGEQPEWAPRNPPGANVVGDPRTWWEALVTPDRQAVAGVDLTAVVDSPRGRRTLGEGLSFPAVDLFIHAWDVARSVGGDVVIPADVIQFAHAVFGPIPARQMRSPGIFADAVTAPPPSTLSEEFIAWTGRDPGWTAPTDGPL